MSPSKIKRKYEKRIISLLNGIRKALADEGHNCGEPFELEADDFRWSMIVETGPDDGDIIDITFTVAESENWDGEKGGVNFMVDVVEYEGRILGGLCPFNYSDEVWVPRRDAAAIEERFTIFERCDPYGIVECVEKSDMISAAKGK